MADQNDPIERPAESPRIRRKFRLPPGALPRYAQQAGLVAVALLMVAIMFLSSSLNPQKVADPAPTTTSDAAQQTSIRDFQRRIQEQADRINRERAELEIAKQALAQRSAGPVRDDWPSTPAAASSGPTPADDRATREERALFADNVAFRRASERQTSAVTPEAQNASEPSEPTRSPNPPVGQHRLLEGQFVETVLTNRLDGGFAGPVNCLVTSPVYARDGETLLIPAGARFLGGVKPVTEMNQRRLAVAFHRLTFPNGTAVALDQLPGLNQIGDTALRDQVSRHYWQTFGATAAVGALAGLSMAQTRYGLDATGGDVYRQGVSTSLAGASTRILERYLNQLPTVTIREGHPVLVYLTADLDLSPYDSSTQRTLDHAREF